MIACRATNFDPIPVPDSTFTDVPLNHTDYSSPGMHSDTINNNREYAIEDGVYDVYGGASFDAGGGTIRMLAIQKNGTDAGGPTIAVNSTPPVGGGNYHSIEVNARGIPMTAGEYVNMLAFQDSGADLDIEGAPGQDFTPVLYLVKVGELPSLLNLRKKKA